MALGAGLCVLLGAAALNAVGLAVGVGGMLMRRRGMLMGRRRVLLRLVMVALRVVTGRLAVMVRRRLMVSCGLVMRSACFGMTAVGIRAAFAPDFLIELASILGGSCLAARVSGLLVLFGGSASFCHDCFPFSQDHTCDVSVKTCIETEYLSLSRFSPEEQQLKPCKHSNR